MCGILGVIVGKGQRSDAAGNFLRQGLVVGMLRGADSTGMLQVMGDNLKVHKATQDGYTFSQMKKTEGLLSTAAAADVTIVHHRAATRGAVCYDNAHPFEHELETSHVIGVHNGTIPAFGTHVDGKEFSVDSDWLYYQIAKHGATKALSDVSGAYALLWYDVGQNLIRMASNLERPLHFAYVKGENTTLIASELEMLYWLATRNKAQIEQPLYVPKGKIISVRRGGDVRDLMVEDIPEKSYSYGRYQSKWDSSKYGPPAIKEFGIEMNTVMDFFPSSPHGNFISPVVGDVLKDDGTVIAATMPYVPPAALESLRTTGTCRVKASGSEAFMKPDGSSGRRLIVYQTVAAAVSEPETAPTSIALVEIPEEDSEGPFVRGPRGRQLTKKRYLELVKDGCGSCSKDLGLKDAEDLGWVYGDSPLCKECMEDMTAAVYLK